jgi:hypothetical protein
MPGDDLLGSVAAAAALVGHVYTRREAPFNPGELRARLAGMTAAARVPDRLGGLYDHLADEIGDGGKTAVLVTAGTVVAALQNPPAEGRGNLPQTVRVLSERAAARVEGFGQFLREVTTFRRALLAAAGGREVIADELLAAFRDVGKDGAISVEAATSHGPPSAVTSGFSDESGTP